MVVLYIKYFLFKEMEIINVETIIGIIVSCAYLYN
jgi:hypothetical protein